MTGHSEPPRVIWSASQRHGALALLCLVGIFNMMDRQIMAILLEPIRKEFGASDTQMGLLTGTTFALFYVAASFPLARAADRYRRGRLLGVVLGFWSLMTLLGGLATSFTTLLLTRIGVAVGEAGSSPASFAMIPDLYPLRNRAKAMSLYMASLSVGTGVAVMVGGWLAENFGWRMALIAAGAPGMLLAVLIWFALAEPPRGMSDPLPAERADTRYGFVDTLRVLWASPTFVCCLLLVSFGALTGYGVMTWGATFLMRVHGLSPAETGLIFGSVSMLALVAGQIFTGVVADWAGRRDIRAYLWCAAAVCALALPFGLLFVLAGQWWLAMVGFALHAFFLGSHSMCAYTISQSVLPPRTRGTASMIISLGATIFGFGFAPLIVGVSNDLLEPIHGVFAIRYSIVIILAFLLVCVISALAGTIWVRREYATLNQLNQQGERT